MSQNLISLSLSAEQLDQVRTALGVLEKNLSGMVSLSVDERVEMTKMGPKSEMALGSDIHRAALDGYCFAKAAGKGAALDELSAHASVRFSGQGRRKGSGQGAAN